MKHLVVATSLALSLSLGTAFAQQAAPATPDTQAAPASPEGHRHHAPDPQRQAQHLSRELNLTPDQTAKIEPILATRDQQVQAIRANGQLTPEDRHQQMRSANQQAEQQMSGILSADQLAQLKAMHHHGHRGPEGGADPNQASPAA